MRTTTMTSGVVLGLLLAAASGCPATFSDVCEGTACPADGDGGPTGDGGINLPPDCDLTKDPKDSPQCVDDAVAVFVSPQGADSNQGTRASPVKSISIGIARAGTSKPRVYICAGTYPEDVSLTTATSLYGGFDCSTWMPVGAPTGVNPTSGLPLKIASVTDPVVVADLQFTAPGGSSIGSSGISAGYFLQAPSSNRRAIASPSEPGGTAAIS